MATSSACLLPFASCFSILAGCPAAGSVTLLLTQQHQLVAVTNRQRECTRHQGATVRTATAPTAARMGVQARSTHRMTVPSCGCSASAAPRLVRNCPA